MSTAAYPIDLDHPNAYELLSLIVDEFEKAALRSETRAGILIVSKSPLSAMDQMLEGSETTLMKAKELSANSPGQTEDSSGSSVSATANSSEDVDQVGATQSQAGRIDRTISEDRVVPAEAFDDEPKPFETNTTPFKVKVRSAEDDQKANIPLPPEVNVQGGAGFDADILAAMQKGMKKKGANKLEEAIEECLGCELSLKFDWQLKPFNLLGPISDMLAEINDALNKLGNMLNPLNVMKGFCNAMNIFSLICLKDWIAILMALKALLKKYLTFSLEIKLDWSIILGPLLKLIIEAFLSLVEQLAGLIIAPLDCAIGVLDSLEDLERAAKELGALAADFPEGMANQVSGLGSQIAGRADTGPAADGLTREVAWTGATPNDPEVPGLDEWHPGKLGVFNSNTPGGFAKPLTKAEKEKKFGEDISKTFRYPTGVNAGLNVPLDQRIGDREWLDGSLFGKLGDSVKEAKQFILDLVNKLKLAFRSLNGLVAGGLSIQIGNLGVLLLIKDLIGVVMMIIDLLGSGLSVKDWCKLAEEDPSSFAAAGRGTGGRPVVEMFVDDDGDLAFAAGPRYTMKADTCISSRSEAQSHVLNQWIKDLERQTP